MPSYEELAAAAAAIRQVLTNGADATLRAIPGVRHTCVALKVTGEFVTNDPCIRVYVREKLPEDQVPPEELIPSQIGGVDTDVVVVKPFTFMADTARYRPLKGGIVISNLIIDVDEDGHTPVLGDGTFGCTATLTSDGSPVLLTNAHILLQNKAKTGDAVFQPSVADVPYFRPSELPKRRVTDEDLIAHITDTVMNEHVDAGIARLDVSSCCRCCGLDFRDEINGLSVEGKPPSNKILGLRRAVPGLTVYKVGSTTGRTEGKVVTDDTDELPPARFNGENYSFRGQIEIASTDEEEYFSLHGDSGAVIIDQDGFIVGLLNGAYGGGPPTHRTFANHIADVCSALRITINMDRSTHSSARALGPASRATFDFPPSRTGAELYAAAKARLLASPAGAWLWALGEEHREEIVSLVTTHRPVTVAWHRAGGPAAFAQALGTLRAGGEALPTPPSGATLEESLARVGDALAAHGSAALREAIALYQSMLLAAVRGSTTLDDVLGKLRP